RATLRPTGGSGRGVGNGRGQTSAERQIRRCLVGRTGQTSADGRNRRCLVHRTGQTSAGAAKSPTMWRRGTASYDVWPVRRARNASSGRSDGEELARSRQALELVISAILELER